MASIELVLYKRENIAEEITLESIEHRKDFDTLKKSLFCAFEGCSARIEYVPKGARIAHFKTWPKSNHSKECVNYFEREKKLLGKKSLASNSTALSDKHIDNVLRNLINTVEETEDEKEQRLKKQRERQRKKNKTTNKENIQQEEQRLTPSTDGNAKTLKEGERAPRVKRRYSISFLNEDDIGIATALYENIQDIQIENNRVTITLKKNNKETKVYLEENFFRNSAFNIESMLKNIKGYLDSKNALELYCVGNVEKRNGVLCLVVNKQNHIRVNKLTIERLNLFITNPELF
ncbi:hypothetical protein NC3_28740 [Bacillus altitudinis]|uniref:hypothetical protein n=1 Tax=Bacillus altitudinis TaxID=293387 RepID=UPI00119D0C79|nr:hypothetical protein [Bacillus altitudinis]QII26080.1 hypothetical protein G3M80_16300 [Bacillus altitudinis]BDC59914.1 hypothetical protein NC3_28740 [Bacillus altitudinis]